MAPSPAFPPGCSAALSLTFDVDAETGVLMPKPTGWRDAMALDEEAKLALLADPAARRHLAASAATAPRTFVGRG